MWSVLLLTLGLLQIAFADHFIRSVGGTKGNYYFKDKNGHRIFLSGANMAWYRYCDDFGDNGFSHGNSHFQTFLQQVQAHGGNSVRVWVHCEGHPTPHFNSQGKVDALQRSGSVTDDMKKFLDVANYRNILVFFVLWNGAQPSSRELAGLITSPIGGSHDKLASYLTQLKHMVNTLKNHPALGGWEIMNEPHGLYTSNHHDTSGHNNCHDTKGWNGGWAVTQRKEAFKSWMSHSTYTMKQLQTFISRQAKAIHDADHMAQITTSTDEYHTTNGGWGRNFFADQCLSDVGGGRLTFYQVHTYASSGHAFASSSPMVKNSWDFNLDKPLVIGEFSQDCSGGKSASYMFKHAYNGNYAGAWIWQWYSNPSGQNECRGDWNQQLAGMAAIGSRTDHGYVKISGSHGAVIG